MGVDGGSSRSASSSQVAPSTYYDAKSRPPSARAVRDAELGPELVRPLEAQLLGLRPAQALEGGPAGRPSTSGGTRWPASCAHQGIRGASRAKKRFTTKSDPAARPGTGPRQPQLHRLVVPTHLWVADFTYCSTWSGIVYVAFVIDVFSRRLVGWKAARSMTDALVLDALNMAAWTSRHTSLDGLMCHTDAGSQYTSIAYTERLDDVGAAPSIGTVGDSYDNAMAESVMGLFKTELHRNPAALAANGGPWKGLDDLEIATCAWVSWFNEERLHSELGDLTPAEFEADYRQRSQPDVA